MQARILSETSVPVPQTTRRHIPEDRNRDTVAMTSTLTIKSLITFFNFRLQHFLSPLFVKYDLIIIAEMLAMCTECQTLLG